MSKRMFILTIVSLASLPVFAQSVFSPMQGVVCDKPAKFCSDEQGISMGITSMYLGEASAKSLLEMINSVGSDNFDTRTFVLSNGVKCDISKKVCTKSKFDEAVDVKTTGWLFGTASAAENFNMLEGLSVHDADKKLHNSGFKLKKKTERNSEIWLNKSSSQCLEIYKDSGLVGSVQSCQN